MIDSVLAGRYRLEEPIARGGMGTVWRAHDEVLQRKVAIKLLSDSLTDDAAASERFRREALTAAALTHANMANVFDYVEEDGRPGIVMELVEGETLAHAIRRGPLPVREAVRIASDILAALHAAHEAGIVHRDIKPANVLLAPGGEVKVSDFGIARSLGEASLTQTGMVYGTVHYSAPEQVRGQAATPSTDLYATAVVLYEMLTGRRPFEGDSSIAIAMARLESNPTPPRSHRPDLPPALEAAILRGLARDPEARYPSALAMRDALQRAVLDAETTAVLPLAGAPDDETIRIAPAATLDPHPEPPIVRELVPPRWFGRRLALVLLPLLLLGLLAFWVVGSLGDGAPAARPSPSQSATVAPAVTTPTLTGFTREQATLALQRAGLRLGTVTTQVTGEARAGTVVDQSPLAGTELERGELVDIVLAAAPPEEKDDDDKDDGGGKGRGKGKGRD